jgi:hypothetical protein
MRVDRSQICYLIIEEFLDREIDSKNKLSNRTEYELGNIIAKTFPDIVTISS